MSRPIKSPHRQAWGLILFAALLLNACAASERSEPLATVLPARDSLQLTSTGFVVDGAGHVLTAGHATENCRRIFVTKDGKTRDARLIARSSVKDLALLQVDDMGGASAVFAQEADRQNPEMAFTASYQTLPRLLADGGALFNAVVTTNREPRNLQADIELISDASFGTSGAPVLGTNGLVIGVITHRNGTGRVMATNGENAKTFLASNGVVFRQGGLPPLSGLQDRAAYAAAISVSVVCPR